MENFISNTSNPLIKFQFAELLYMLLESHSEAGFHANRMSHQTEWIDVLDA